MVILKEFERKISLVDGMLIETGGRFGEKGMENYLSNCVKIASEYYREKEDKRELLNIVDLYIGLYENETSWIFYHDEMKFLHSLKALIEQL